VPDSVDVAVPGDPELEPEDELALFTADSTCAGRSVWDADADPTTIVAAGPNRTSGTGDASGYEAGAPIRLEMWDASQGREYEVGTALSYGPCGPDSPLCRNDGRYETGTIHVLDRIGSADRLPVELTRFSALRRDDRVRLVWVTARETDNAGFAVQHRGPSSPHWSDLQFVEADRTSGPSQYQYTTSPLAPGRHTFRLRQVDDDGTTSRSETVEIVQPLPSTVSLTEVRPQPIEHRGTVHLRVRRRQHVTAVLYNVLGQRVRTLLARTVAPNHRHKMHVRAQGLADGYYVLRVRGDTFSATRRVTITR
jgi:hypothetical protein